MNSVYFTEGEQLKLTALAKRSRCSESRVLRNLLNKEWDNLVETGEITIDTLPHPPDANPVPVITVKETEE